MTLIKDIRVFDERDCSFNVSDLKIDNTNGSLTIYIEPPTVDLKKELCTPYDIEEIERKIENVLIIEGIPLSSIHFYGDSGIISLRLKNAVATIEIAELLNIDEDCITPYDRGYAYINVCKIEDSVGIDDLLV